MPFLLKLTCGHRVVTDVVLNLQYPNDIHFIYCPPCRKSKDHYASKVPTAWNEVVSLQEHSHGHLFNVFGKLPLVVSRDIMRLQPRITNPLRLRPFPYVNTKRKR